MRFIKQEPYFDNGQEVQNYLDSESNISELVLEVELITLKTAHEQSPGYASNVAAQNLVADINESLQS